MSKRRIEFALRCEAELIALRELRDASRAIMRILVVPMDKLEYVRFRAASHAAEKFEHAKH